MGIKYAKNALAAGTPPGLRWGAHDALPDPLVGWGGEHPLPIPTPLGAFDASILSPSALIFCGPQCKILQATFLLSTELFKALHLSTCRTDCSTSLICRRDVEAGCARRSSLLDVRPLRRVTVGDRSFAAAGLRLWNSLPADVQSAPSLTTFRQMKTHLHISAIIYPETLFFSMRRQLSLKLLLRLGHHK